MDGEELKNGQVDPQGEEKKPETNPQGEEKKPTNQALEIDYDKIINGVFEKMNKVKETEDEKHEEETIKEPKNSYIEKSVEFELKYNNLNKSYEDLQNKQKGLEEELKNTKAKLAEYESFGKSSEEVQENKRLLKNAQKQYSGLLKL